MGIAASVAGGLIMNTVTPESRDAATTVADLRALVEHFVGERDWHRYHNPKNLAMSLAIETGELMEHFQWLTLQQARELQQDPAAMQQVGEELADCLAYILAFANAMEIDLSSTLAAKMRQNEAKYPPGEC
jgi:NTP pyrophosphatase (non-canonical NTP hydrolase)